MTGDGEKLQNVTKYKEGRAVVTTNNSRLPIAHVDTTVMVHTNRHFKMCIMS